MVAHVALQDLPMLCALMTGLEPFSACEPLACPEKIPPSVRPAEASVRQSHLSNGSVLLSFDAVLQAPHVGEAGTLQAAVTDGSGPWTAQLPVNLSQPGENVVTLQARLPPFAPTTAQCYRSPSTVHAPVLPRGGAVRKCSHACAGVLVHWPLSCCCYTSVCVLLLHECAFQAQAVTPLCNLADPP